MVEFEPQIELMDEKKKVEEEKKLQSSLSTEIIGEKKIDTANGKKMEEEVLDDGKEWIRWVICRIDVSFFPVQFSSFFDSLVSIQCYLPYLFPITRIEKSFM